MGGQFEAKKGGQFGAKIHGQLPAESGDLFKRNFQSSDQNNGWTGFTTASPIHNGNTIGVNRNGSVAEAFYQPLPFCSTEDVHIFTPRFPMTKYAALFLATLIKKEKFRFNYGRKWGIG